MSDDVHVEGNGGSSVSRSSSGVGFVVGVFGGVVDCGVVVGGCVVGGSVCVGDGVDAGGDVLDFLDFFDLEEEE